MYWHSIQIKWRSPKKSISGKITIRYIKDICLFPEMQLFEPNHIIKLWGS